jgi:hypothetical protein
LTQTPENPPHATAVHHLGLLRRVPLALSRDHLEGDLLQMAPAGCRIDPFPPHAGITGEVRIHRETGDQVRRDDIPRRHVEPQEGVEVDLLVPMGRLGREGHDLAARDDLVARDLRHHQMIIDRRGPTARQAQGPAGRPGRFETHS